MDNTYKARILVINRRMEIVPKTVEAKTEAALQKKIAKIEEAGHLYRVEAYQNPGLNQEE